MMSGDLLIDATQVQNSVALTVPLGRSVLFSSVRENEPSPKFGAVICELHDAVAPSTPAGITCSRNNAGTDSTTSTGQINIHWTVATFTSGVSVQRGEANTTATNPTVVTLSPAIDPASSFIVLGGMFNGGTGWGNNEFVRARLVDGQTLDVRTNVPGTSAAWQVVTMSGASVQRGTAAFATADTQQQVTISPITTNGLLLASYTTDNVNGIAAATLMMQSTQINANTLSFSRNLGGSALDVSWEIAALPFATHQVTTSFAASEAMKTETVAGLAIDTSVALATSQAILGQSSGSTSYAGTDLDLPGEAAVTLTPMPGTVVLQRSTSQATASITWTAIDFSRDSCTGM